MRSEDGLERQVRVHDRIGRDASLRQLKASALSAPNAHLVAVIELCDRVTDRRLAQVQTFGCARDAAGAAEFADVHKVMTFKRYAHPAWFNEIMPFSFMWRICYPGCIGKPPFPPGSHCAARHGGSQADGME